MKDLRDRYKLDSNRLKELREKHFIALSSSLLPVVGKIKLSDFHFEKLNTKYHEDLNEITETIENTITIKNGNIVSRNLSNQFDKITILTYFEAKRDNNSLVLKTIEANLEKTHDDFFQTQNSAFLNSALYIHVPRNVVVKTALKLNIICDADLAHHTYLIVDKNSEFTLLEKLESTANVRVNYISETTVAQNAKVNYIGIDNFLCQSAYIKRVGDVMEDGSLVYAQGGLNAGNTLSENYVRLSGTNAYAESRNVLLTEKDYTHAVRVKIEHFAPHTKGYITNHGIALDHSLLQIDGIGKINQGMSLSDNQQTTHVIMLSDNARALANPYLLIDEYDVMAGHGASVGSVDEEMLYYLMSRGLERYDAEKLIIMGFLYPVIELIESDVIKADFIKTIGTKLNS